MLFPENMARTNENPVAVLCDATKQYAGKLVVKGIGIEVPQGEFVAITGHSGSGKSTILRMMQAIERPDSGSVSLLGQELNELSPKAIKQLVRKHVGIGFQSANLDSNFSVAANIRNIARGNGYNVTNNRIVDLATHFGLGHKLSQNAGTLSGGEQMRVSLIRALINRPEVVFLDEPTGALDTASSKKAFQGLQKIVQEDNTTVVMVTHDADIARNYIDREFVIESGKLIDTQVYSVMQQKA